MSEDKNIVDFAARAAQVRAMHTGYLLTELDGTTLKGIFEAAHVDCRLDDDGDCVVEDELRLFVSADPRRDLFKLFAFFSTSGTREQALAFCDRFNLGMIVARAQVRETADSDGEWPVVIDHDRLVFDGERVEARTIVKMVRRFQYIVRNGITKYDEEKIF